MTEGWPASLRPLKQGIGADDLNLRAQWRAIIPDLNRDANQPVVSSNPVCQATCSGSNVLSRLGELDSYERTRAARITSKKPNGPRRQLAVMTPPINAPMMPSNAASVPVRYKFLIGVRGRSHA
jgi:hypothetical protein